MTENRQFRFTHDVNASAFSKELSHRVDRYFQERGISRHADEEGHISNNYIQHIFDTTSDYANRPLTNWVLGGLNLHVIHHMFPAVCHVHYPALTKIVRSTAEEYGLTYRETRTITGAFLAHLRWLKVLGSV